MNIIIGNQTDLNPSTTVTFGFTTKPIQKCQISQNEPIFNGADAIFIGADAIFNGTDAILETTMLATCLRRYDIKQAKPVRKQTQSALRS